MKRLLLAGVLLAVALFASAQVVVYEDTAELAWNAPTETLLPGDVVSYEVYYYDYSNPVIDNQNIAELIFAGATENETLTITFTDRKEWAVGVRSIVTDGGGTSGIPSILAWSINEGDVDTVAMGGPFYYTPLILGQASSPDSLKDQRY